MAQPTHQQINDALVAIVAGAAPDAKVWNRVRIGTTNEEFAQLYAKNGVANVWFVRRIAIIDETTSFDDIVTETHRYEIRHARSLVDVEENGTNEASERLFQRDIETVRAALNADKNIGLGLGASHKGFQILNAIPIVDQLGPYTVHMAVGSIDVVVQDC